MRSIKTPLYLTFPDWLLAAAVAGLAAAVWLDAGAGRHEPAARTAALLASPTAVHVTLPPVEVVGRRDEPAGAPLTARSDDGTRCVDRRV